jgi:hypothetical protein
MDKQKYHNALDEGQLLKQTSAPYRGFNANANRLVGISRLIGLMVFVISAQLQAQHYGPLGHGYYAGIHAARVNPALTAYSAYDIHFNIIGGWVNANNSYLKLSLPYSAYKFIDNGMAPQYKTENGNPTFDTSWIKERINGNNKFLAAGAQVYGPSVMLKFKGVTVGLLTDVNVSARASGISEPLAHAILKDMSINRNAYQYFNFDANNTNKTYTIPKATVSVNSWVSTGINVSYAIPQIWKKQLLIGITAKRVWGIGGGYAQVGEMNFTQPTREKIILDQTSIKYGTYTGSGSGSGVDLGLGWVYHKPDYKQNGYYRSHHKQYIYKFGLSVMDIGAIRYRKAETRQILNAAPQVWDMQNERDRFLTMDYSINGLDNILKTELSTLEANKGELMVGLPTRLVFSVDYMLKKQFFINTQWVQSLRSRYSIHARYQSFLMVAPRYETPFFEVSLPLALEYDYRSFRAGAMVRVGWFYIGTNSLMSLLNTKQVRDADLYLGVAISALTGSRSALKMQKFIESRSVKKVDSCHKM